MNSNSPYFAKESVDQIVGPLTFAAFQSFTEAEAFVIRRGSLGLRQPLERATRLTESRQLTVSHVSNLRLALILRDSYWVGDPIYRRLPPTPDFVINCKSSPHNLVIAVDLLNPGWRFHCHKELYEAFTFAEVTVRTIAKELFPEFASPNKNAMWAKGAWRSRSE